MVDYLEELMKTTYNIYKKIDFILYFTVEKLIHKHLYEKCLCYKCLIEFLIVHVYDGIHEKVDLSVSGEDVAKERRNIKHVQSSTPFTMDKHLDLSSQTELVGHSTVRPLSLHFRAIRRHTMVNFCHILLQVLASPYSNPQFGQFLTTYGQPAMVCYQHIATAYENQSHSNCLFLNI